MLEQQSFNDFFRAKSKAFAISIIKYFKSKPETTDWRIIKNQLIKSSSSCAANFRASCRARSSAEYFAKICIVVEEADESLFWLEVIEESDLDKSDELKQLQKEATEIVSIISKSRKNLK